MRGRAPKAGLVLALSLLVLGSPARSQPQPASSAASSTPLSRYSLAGGCYEVRTGSGQALAAGDEPLRMQAAALGQYLLYGVHQDYLGQGLTAVSTPSDATL